MTVAAAASPAALSSVRRGIMRLGVGAVRARFAIWLNLLRVRILQRYIGHLPGGGVHRTRTFIRTGAHRLVLHHVPAKPGYGHILKRRWRASIPCAAKNSKN